MKERLIPVTDRGQLRVGMIVVLRPCRHGCQRHRGMLLAYLGEVASHRECWRVTDLGACQGGCWEDMMSMSLCIPEGRLFRVDDGLEDEQTVTKRKERVK